MTPTTSLCTIGLSTLCLFMLACGDDGGAATDDGDSGGETASETSSSTTGDTTGDSTDTTGDSTDTTGDTTGDTTDTGEQACPVENSEIGGWYLSLSDGDFPNDVPTDVDESCTVTATPADQLGLDCPFGGLQLHFDAAPPPLPSPGATAQLRLHHEPGWLDWPDLWIDVSVDGGDAYALQSASVLSPTRGAYVVPWAPSLADVCGPFVASDPFLGEDPCGAQMGQELSFTVDGEQVVAWHGTQVSADVGGRAFEVWLQVARQYLMLPETCDVSPRWYSWISRRAQAG